MRVAVIGGGAVGLGLASCLLAAGEPVRLQLRRPDAADALRRHGLSRGGIFGEALAAPGSFEVGTELAALPSAEPDVILVCTKNTARDAVADALAEIWPALPARPALVLCLNGCGGAERFAESLPRDRIFNAVVTTGFRRQGWNRVEITVHGDEIHMGSLFGSSERELAPLCDAISKGGIPCAPSARVQVDLWEKLLYNCALNPLAAVLAVPYGVLAESPQSRSILEAIVREIFAVQQAAGHGTAWTRWTSADAYLAHFFRELLPQTRGHESSMLQDLRAGRATEIDALNGAIVEFGRRAGIDAPVNGALATLVKALHPAP